MGTLALVTGGNRGIGLEICRQLARDHGVEVILTARSPEDAEQAAAALTGEVHPEVVDVADDASVNALRERVGERFGRLDVLVNNAGVAIDGWSTSALEADLDVVRETLEINTYGALRMAAAFGPWIAASDHGRIVNVSSGMGGVTEMGGRAPGYRISKAGLNAVTRMLAAELADAGVLVNSACPGWVKTALGTDAARLEVDEGADTPVWLATLPDDGPTGGFFRERKPIAF